MSPESEHCPCYTCANKRPSKTLFGFQETFDRMIVCPDCGNKRCPKALHHDSLCTGSNEPGQVGSACT